MFLFLAALPAHLMNASCMQGLIWYVLPMTLITLNDIAAFYVGFFFGRTPLIKLSPKKTWEGFIGGGFITVALGTAISLWFGSLRWLTCPVVAGDVAEFMRGQSSLLEVDMECQPNKVFSPKKYEVSLIIN